MIRPAPRPATDQRDTTPPWLRPVSLYTVRWHRRFAVRLGVAVAGLILLSGASSYFYQAVVQRPAVEAILREGYAVAYDPGEIQALEAADGEPVFDDSGHRLISEADWQARLARIERNFTIASALLGLALAALLGWIISRRVTRRLRRMVEQLQQPIGEDRALPGPFDVSREDEIGALATTMNQMRDRIRLLVEHLARRDQDRRRWVALVSHDLRNPLQALTACIDRAAGEAEKIRDPERRAHMERLLGTAQLDVDRFEVLTQDLLDIARLDADDSLDLEPVPPGQLARSAAASMRVLAESVGRSLEVDVAPGLPELDADGRRMLRALENLLRNAIQHARSEVVLHVEPCAEGVRFAVDDDGAGLPAGPDGEVDLARLGAYKSRDDSAGLGLVVTRRVAEAHGGRIGGHNRTGAGGAVAGATVWFEVPVGGGVVGGGVEEEE